ncbi:ABC transporter ATP-binding protein [Paenibacillus xylaniclasticus]|uniref:ABC transporter ATP-binding protein n=1 Tax=Paenibacillus xylaniclasticus TaxID=588083 RepID=UPI000FDBBE95|nr:MULTISPECIES: ABC transporter ATP-binding protein [Paenibacillus]GFN32888.1 ABC transporter ATP-binding protein [Paenibacillus curdlanolyticus]
MHLLEIDRISKVYKKGKSPANRDISFSIREGEIIGLLGPNGAGKSTLVKQLVGLLAPSSGEIRYRGVNVLKQQRRISSEISYYAQEPHALGVLTAGEALLYTGILRGLPRREAEKQTRELLERFNMGELINRPIKKMSGGQRRMIGMGTTLIGNAPVLVFDEPTNELDPLNRKLVWDLIVEHNRRGATIILVTHNVLEAERVVDRVAFINHGRLLEIDSVAQLKQRVDGRLKLDLTAAYGEAERLIGRMEGWGDIQRTGEHRIRLYVSKERAGRLLDWMIHDSSLPIDEYAVYPPSLEDVYVYIDKQKAGAAHA